MLPKFLKINLSILIFVLLALSFRVAFYSSLNSVHPDEANHLDAGRYYKSHWKLAAIDDPDIKPSRSIFGVSYLDEPEVGYYIAGKFARLLESIVSPDTLNFRIFHLILLILSIGIIFWNRLPNSLLIPLLTPQVWYVFSYFNGDAFPLFLSLCCVFVVRRFWGVLQNENVTSSITTLSILLGSFTGLLLVSKKNYLFFLFFLMIVLLWQLFVIKDAQQNKLFRKFITQSALVSLSLYLVVTIVDLSRNGIDRNAKLASIVEHSAGVPFKRSTPLSESYFALWLKDKGVAFEELFTVWKWHKSFYQSFVGQYGYMSVIMSERYYRIFKIVLLSILAFVLVQSVRKIETSVVFISFTLCLTMLIAATLYRSWTFDFQAQGRYLFPALSMLGIVVALNKQLDRSVVLQGLLLACYVLGTYSFVVIQGSLLF